MSLEILTLKHFFSGDSISLEQSVRLDRQCRFVLSNDDLGPQRHLETLHMSTFIIVYAALFAEQALPGRKLSVTTVIKQCWGHSMGRTVSNRNTDIMVQGNALQQPELRCGYYRQ